MRYVFNDGKNEVDNKRYGEFDGNRIVNQKNDGDGRRGQCCNGKGKVVQKGFFFVSKQKKCSTYGDRNVKDEDEDDIWVHRRRRIDNSIYALIYSRIYWTCLVR